LNWIIWTDPQYPWIPDRSYRSYREVRKKYLSTVGADCRHGGSSTLAVKKRNIDLVTNSVNSRTEHETGYSGLDTTKAKL